MDDIGILHRSDHLKDVCLWEDNIKVDQKENGTCRLDSADSN